MTPVSPASPAHDVGRDRAELLTGLLVEGFALGIPEAVTGSVVGEQSLDHRCQMLDTPAFPKTAAAQPGIAADTAMPSNC
ncbi:hypothetical protein [Nocardia sp. XZ_19_231]|uniref:hypothetical protein n=1 Tax=Nocardia sp. XZ_19_231 TaxID=2769252 RepID=UPI00189006A2|nr:hypothetical protein [Nocardia sp. XZ_19_231]